MILELWKDWDDNKLDRHDYFSDTIVMYFPDGSVTKGKQQCLKAAIQFRDNFTKSVSVIHAWVPLKSTDRQEDVVCVWGQEEDTHTDGSIGKRDIHEVWWFNKDGKVTSMRQWASRFGTLEK
jgi:hypothetical protein